MDTAETAPAVTFADFYRDHYLAEHQRPVNVALHMAGTVGGLGYVAWVLAAAPLYWLALFPVVHALPGLLGHSVFERNPTVGDARLLRRDFALWWFIAANHLLLWRLIRRGER